MNQVTKNNLRIIKEKYNLMNQNQNLSTEKNLNSTKISTKMFHSSKSSKNFVFLLFKILIILNFSINQIKAYDYCCCLFSQDPFRGYNIIKSQILSFDHSHLDKESIGSKMINQCYRTFNGFPSLENINYLKRDIFTINQKTCDKDCNYFIRDLNEKYNIKQEQNREKEAKRLKDVKRKLDSILKEKLIENMNNLYKGKPCNAKIKNLSVNDLKSNSFKIPDSDLMNQNGLNSDSNPYIPSVGDLSIDSDNDEEPSYLDLNNPKYNIEIRNKIDEELKNKKLKESDFDDENELENKKNKKKINRGFNNSSETNFQNEITDIEINSELKLSNLLKNNPNYLSVKTSFKEETEFSQSNIQSEDHLKTEIENIEVQIIYLNKKNKKPIDFILDRFSIKDDVLVKIIKIFELSLDEVIHNLKIYFEDTVYFQFKVAEKYNASSKNNLKKI